MSITVIAMVLLLLLQLAAGFLLCQWQSCNWHQAAVNALAWGPHSSCHICTAGDDSQALIWDLSSMSQPMDTSLDPILAYSAGAEVNQLQWSTTQPDWVAICFGSKTQILRV